jgi:acetyl-CoA carboxylase, biotin carboxylase subunit
MKVLVANRGEIAVRVLRACRELGFPCVAVYSDVDAQALHVRYADEALPIGPAAASESYLSIEKILQAARACQAEAIHPGYGFLSENAAFAQAVEEAGLVFIGPRPETIALTGDKLVARRVAREVGLPVLPGPDVPVSEPLPVNLPGKVSYPLLIKAVAGGGGRGIRLARSPAELECMVLAARQEAQAAFGDDAVYFEPLVQQARHIEVQIFGDGFGRVLCLGERECSIQRRRQKLIEEAPAPSLSPVLRRRLYDAALSLGQALKYRSLGTVEFLLDDSGAFYFIEVNPRIQVEHPVTEMVTGIDLVSAQLRLAESHTFKYAQEDILTHGAAIEARILAEDPENGFLPATGEITHLKEPGGPGVRVDSALVQGMLVTPDYDSLLAKVIAWGEDRQTAIRRLRRALIETRVGGVPSDLDFLVQIIDSDSFIQGRANTTYLDTFQPVYPEGEEALEREMALAAAILEDQRRQHAIRPAQSPSPSVWHAQAWREQMHSARIK